MKTSKKTKNIEQSTDPTLHIFTGNQRHNYDSEISSVLSTWNTIRFNKHTDKSDLNPEHTNEVMKPNDGDDDLTASLRSSASLSPSSPLISRSSTKSNTRSVAGSFYSSIPDSLNSSFLPESCFPSFSSLSTLSLKRGRSTMYLAEKTRDRREADQEHDRENRQEDKISKNSQNPKGNNSSLPSFPSINSMNSINSVNSMKSTKSRSTTTSRTFLASSSYSIQSSLTSSVAAKKYVANTLPEVTQTAILYNFEVDLLYFLFPEAVSQVKESSIVFTDSFTATTATSTTTSTTTSTSLSISMSSSSSSSLSSSFSSSKKAKVATLKSQQSSATLKRISKLHSFSFLQPQSPEMDTETKMKMDGEIKTKTPGNSVFLSTDLDTETETDTDADPDTVTVTDTCGVFNTISLSNTPPLPRRVQSSKSVANLSKHSLQTTTQETPYLNIDQDTPQSNLEILHPDIVVTQSVSDHAHTDSNTDTVTDLENDMSSIDLNFDIDINSSASASEVDDDDSDDHDIDKDEVVKRAKSHKSFVPLYDPLERFFERFERSNASSITHLEIFRSYFDDSHLPLLLRLISKSSIKRLHLDRNGFTLNTYYGILVYLHSLIQKQQKLAYNQTKTEIDTEKKKNRSDQEDKNRQIKMQPETMPTSSPIHWPYVHLITLRNNLIDTRRSGFKTKTNLVQLKEEVSEFVDIYQ